MGQRSFKLLLFVLSLAIPGIAQQAPAWEFFAGYSLQRSNVREYFKSTPILYTTRGRYIYLNGWDLSVTENLNPWFGGTLDISGHSKTPVVSGTTNREQMVSILYGPRFSYRTRKVVPFAHLLMGAAHSAVTVTPVGPHASETSFAAAIGGGVDLNLQNKAAVRLLQADYFRTDVLGTRPHSYRASAGVLWYLGKTK